MENIQININNKINYIKEKITYKNVLKWLVVLATLIIAYNSLTQVAHAATFLSYGNGDDPFASITKGWGQFVSDKYRNNYYLDILDLSTFEWIDKTMNMIINMMFSFIVLMSWFGINIFRFCFTNDIASSFGKTLEGVMTSLNNGVFNSFFMTIFMISLFSIVYQLWKKNYSAIAGQLLATALIFALSGVFANGAVKFLSATTDFSKQIGVQAIVSINGQKTNPENETTLENYSKEIVGTLWGNFVHQPWVMLEFDGKLPLVDKNDKQIINEKTEEYSRQILSHPEGSDERKKILEDIRKEYGNDLFSEDSMNDKFVSLFMLILITAVKMIILIAIGMIQIGFQLFAILLVLLVPFVLLVSIVPFFGGFNLLKELGRRFLGTQFGIIISSFLLALLVLIDNVTLNMFQNWGANLVMALLMQCTCWIMLITFRKQLFNGLTSLQNKIASGTANPLKLGNKVVDKSADVGNKYIKEPVMTTAADVKNNLVTKATDAKDMLKSQAAYAGAYAKGNLNLYKDKKLAQTIDFLGGKYEDFKNKYNNSSKTNPNDDELLNRKTGLNNINEKQAEKLDLKGIKAKKPLENSTNVQNENIKNKPLDNLDEETISKENIENPNKNTSKKIEKIQDDTVKNNEINTDNIKSAKGIDGNLNSTMNDEITTKPKDLKPIENQLKKSKQIEENPISQNSPNNIAEAPNDLVEKQSVEKIAEAKTKNSTNFKNKPSIENEKKKVNNTDTTTENIITNKYQTKKQMPKNDPSNLKVTKENIKPVNANERVEKLKNFLGVTEEQITKKEKILNKNLNNMKQSNQKKR
ncbi:TcpH [Clostridium perfringens]|uniref:CD3337/EF1877 family mobilome membrane protein n=1 Tax=Clostridium perfringens TaxID=1502 RepID=UPI001ABA64F4|nr:TcpH [Clostridium perfringens]MBO3304597.1 TcpH [Clostridium perfringens]MBO3307914.1 TcpH [Clostridium perfringens]MBO3311260.1 TcpH [Clostridium perfringens]MBO3317594.1 TcpH [Clostridium perfringens]MBO3392711.1 TcpH [Clostridium perfringens]